MSPWLLIVPSPAVTAPASPDAFPEIPPGAWLAIEGDIVGPGRMIAQEIEPRQPMAEPRISGQVTGLVGGTAFSLLGFRCVLTPETSFRDEEGNDVPRSRLVDGAWIQVRAVPSEDGTFGVQRVKFLAQPEDEIQAPVLGTGLADDGMLLYLPGLTVEVDSDTEFKGDWSQPLTTSPPASASTSGNRSLLATLFGGLLPYRWGGELSVAHEDRPSDGDTGDPATGTGNPTFWFAEPEDVIGLGGIWAQWKLRPFRHPTRIELAYRREQWAVGTILSRDRFEFKFRQGLSPGSRLDFQAEYSPQIYVTHRADKDAAPGEPVFRPDAYREVELELSLRRELYSRMFATVFATYTSRQETRWFRERDRTRPGAGAGIELPLAGWFQFHSEYQYRVTSSSNEPDLGRDLSYREHVIDLALRGPVIRITDGWQFTVAARWKLRSYTTDDPDDERRFARSERIVSWRATIGRPVGQFTPYVAWETLGRSVNAPGDIDIVIESEDYGRTLLRAGVAWEWDLGS